MNKSEAINELAAALAAAQGEMKAALKSSANPFFKSRYADLASIIDAVRGPLSAHGLSIVQLPVPSDKEEVRVETVLLHASGQWISSEVVVPVAKADAQGYGSAMTYAKRYGGQAMVFLAAEEEDDDGNAAAKAKPRPTEAEMTPRAKAPLVPASSVVNVETGEIEPPRPVTFTIAKAHYTTAGMTEAQMRASFDLVPVVDRRYGNDYCRALLKTEFGVVSRSDLTEEAASKYLVRLTELKESA